MKSPTFALLRMKVLIRPPGTSRIRKPSSSWSGAELKEYERVSLLPGTFRFTYWPGRKDSGRSAFSVKLTVVGDSRSILDRWPPWLPTSVLQAADEAGTRITQSDLGDR